MYECCWFPDEFVDVLAFADSEKDFATMMLLNVNAAGKTNGLNHHDAGPWLDAAVPVMIGITSNLDIVTPAPPPGAAADNDSVKPALLLAVVPERFVRLS